jgi:hypothetical protein
VFPGPPLRAGGGAGYQHRIPGKCGLPATGFAFSFCAYVVRVNRWRKWVKKPRWVSLRVMGHSSYVVECESGSLSRSPLVASVVNLAL